MSNSSRTISPKGLVATAVVAAGVAAAIVAVGGHSTPKASTAAASGVPAGSKAVAIAKGALATDDRVFDGVCRQFGVTRAGTVEEAFEAAAQHISMTERRSMMRRSSSSDIGMTSWSANRPRYPVRPHAAQPTARWRVGHSPMSIDSMGHPAPMSSSSEGW